MHKVHNFICFSAFCHLCAFIASAILHKVLTLGLDYFILWQSLKLPRTRILRTEGVSEGKKEMQPILNSFITHNNLKGVTMKHFTVFAVLAVVLVAIFATTAQAAVGTFPYGYGWTGSTTITGDGNWSNVNTAPQANAWIRSATGGNFDAECASIVGFKGTSNNARLRLAVDLTGKDLDGSESFSFYITRTATGGQPATITVQWSANGGTSWTTFTGGSFNLTTFVPTVNQYELVTVNFPATGLDGIANAMVSVLVTPTQNGNPVFDNVLIDDAGIEGGALPIQLASFNASLANGSDVLLEWVAQTQVNNYGFYIQRRLQGETEFTEVPNSFVQGHGTTTQPMHYSWTDLNVPAGSYEYRLRQVDLDGTAHLSYPVSIVVPGVLSVRDGQSVPAQFKLDQNYPNPFNPSTKITFSLAEPNFTTLRVFNIIGQEVATLFSGIAEAGRAYVFNFDASNIGSGVYFYRVESGSKVDIKRMILMK